MIYQIIILRENKINAYFNKLQKNIKTMEICSPAKFVNLSETFSLHKFNSSYLFKVRNNSSLAYFICKISNKEQAVLNTISKEFDVHFENIKHTDRDEVSNMLLFNIGLCVLFLLNLDVLLAMLFYILNFKRFTNINQLYKLNIFTVLASIIGLLNLSVLGISWDWGPSGPSPLLSFPPNIGYWANGMEYKLVYGLIMVIVSHIISTLLFSIHSKRNDSECKNILNLKVQQ
jgi:hypothetical protein